MTYLTAEERAAAVAGLATGVPVAETPAAVAVAETPAATPETPTPETPAVVEKPAVPDAALSKQHDALLAKMDVLFEKLTPKEQAKVEAVPAEERASYWESVLKNPDISADERAHAEQGLKLEQRLAKTEERLAEREERDAKTEADQWVEQNVTEIRKEYELADEALAKVFEWIGDPKNVEAVPHLTFEDMCRKALGKVYLAAHARTPESPAPNKVPVKEPRPATVVAESTPGGSAVVGSAPEVPGVSGIRSAVMDILQNHRSKIGSYD